MFLTVALFGYAAADTRSRFSHGKVEKGERHIPDGKAVYMAKGNSESFSKQKGWGVRHYEKSDSCLEKP